MDAIEGIPFELKELHHILTMSQVSSDNLDRCSSIRQNVQTHCLTVMRQAVCLTTNEFTDLVRELQRVMADYLQWHSTVQVHQLQKFASHVVIIADITSAVSDLVETMAVLDGLPPLDNAKRQNLPSTGPP